jgi:3-methyladenine DNA glycosylase AlkD
MGGASRPFFVHRHQKSQFALRTSAAKPCDETGMKHVWTVTLIIFARRGLYLPLVFRIADVLLGDTDDMVQKGYGWMLKAASESHEQEVFDFVMERRAVMPRTALRYAIEKMPQERRKLAMSEG